VGKLKGKVAERRAAAPGSFLHDPGPLLRIP
jgi:hypothetical protein